MREGESGRKKKVLHIAIVLALAIVIATAAAYNYLHNTLTVALIESLSTFEVANVEYPSVQPDSVQLNITFFLENPTDFSLNIEAISISLWVNEEYLVAVNIPLDENLPAGAKTFFYSIQNVADKSVLNSIQNQTYTLGVKGEIVGSIQYLFVQAHVNKKLVFSESVVGPQAKS